MAKNDPNLLHMFNPTKNVSPFDVNMAYEANFDGVIPYTEVTLEDIHALTQDTIFSRGPAGVKRTGIFIGGREFGLALDMLNRARVAMVPPFEVSVFADPSGAITTAAAAIACIESVLKKHKDTDLKDKKLYIFGGTGPVGVCAGILADHCGAKVYLASHRGQEVGRKVAEEYNGRFKVDLDGAGSGSTEDIEGILDEADVVVGAAKAGIRILSQEQLQTANKLLVAADINAVPPLGIEGVETQDMGKVLDSTPSKALGIGALAIGDVKYKVHKQMFEMMIQADQALYLDHDEASKWPGQSLAKSSVLILALSANPLVKAALYSGYQAYSLDCFADIDTQALALDARRIGYANGLWDIEAIQYYIDQLKHLPIEAIVVGSGLEQYPQQLDALRTDIPILQNPATSHAAIHRMFIAPAPISASVQIAQTLSNPPPANTRDTWLIKPTGGCGGEGIRKAAAADVIQEKEICQRFISGQSYSLTMIADGKAVQNLGLNQLWNIQTPDSAFAYGGCISHVSFNQEMTASLEIASTRLCQELELHGLLGMDFIVDDANIMHIIDINPRPTASFSLYDDQQAKLFQAHLDSLRGLELGIIEPNKTIQAHAVIYAADAFSITLEQVWPDWVTCRPPLASLMAPGDPVCVIHAEGGSQEMVKKRLKERFSALEQLFNDPTSLRMSKEI